MAMLMAGIVLTVLSVGVVSVLLRNGPLEIPMVQTLVQERLNTQMAGETVQIGGVSLLSGTQGVGNSIQLRDVEIADAQGRTLLVVPELRTRFSLLSLLHGRVAPEDIGIVGSQLSLERAEDGTITLFGDGAGLTKGLDVLALLDGLQTRVGLRSLKKIELFDTEVTYLDRASGRSWVLANSTLAITRDGDRLSGRAELALSEGKGGAVANDATSENATMILNGDYVLGSEEATVSFQFANAAPSEIADIFQAFDWLRNLETTLSGSVRASLSGNGTLGDLHGVLQLSEGALAETPDSQPITFTQAKVYFEYNHENDALNLTQVDLETSSGALQAAGFAQMHRGAEGRVDALSGQLRLSDISIQRPDLFDQDVGLSSAALDARVSFAPLTIEVGRLAVFDGDTTIKVKGKSVAGETYWENSYDVDVNRIGLERLKQLWPKPVVDKTRRWINENVSDGRIVNFAGGMRSYDGDYEYAFNFGVEAANFRFVKTVPNLQEGAGFGYLTHQDLRLDLSSGYVVAPNGTEVDVAGSGLFIPDIHQRPSPGEITLSAKGDVGAALGLLNVEKFQFLNKVGLSEDVAEGQAVVRGTFKLPLDKHAKTSDVKMDLTAQLGGVHSDTLIEGKSLTADALVAHVTDQGVTLSGDVKLDAVPVTARWTQAFGKDVPKQSTVTAAFDLSDRNLRALGIQLPDGTISGQARGAMEITLKKGAAPSFVMSSNLQGARLSISALNWSKAAATSGKLDMTGHLGDQPQVHSIAFSAPGLSAQGTLDLNADGSLRRARFGSVSVGRWLDTSAVLTPTGNGSSTISVNGGRADLRYLDDASDGGNSGGTGSSTINLALDQVRITDSLTLSAFSGKLNTAKGLRGSFVGRINGGTRVDGQLFPQEHGTALELTSKDAGGVLQSAGLLKNARGGELRLVLVPRSGDGNYDGSLNVKRTRLRDASAMAGLLNAISVVGLLQQLEGEGIHFNTVEGQFKLRSNGVKLERISAVGPSMGMTLDGWYDTARKSVNFEGVVTPLYAVNGIFERLFGPLMGRRKGEGMFSFTYKMQGAADDPKVSVNPLSILTPGAFREIFRTKPPAPPAQ
ncbi:hypothetical protein GCM10011498_08650 [Amylibacter cionae]|uniref:YhdP central domain-containing protein n=2 Tax=Neptunicoccus cionae TaxID=2035344 RepID=A0A916QTZ2_9RHOB|nr:hypothetical protein GCM10011498_08650 [Amylibacter cionae]